MPLGKLTLEEEAVPVEYEIKTIIIIQLRAVAGPKLAKAMLNLQGANLTTEDGKSTRWVEFKRCIDGLTVEAVATPPRTQNVKPDPNK